MFRSLKQRSYRVQFNIESYLAIAKAKKHFPDLSKLENPFFIIGIPGSLCEVEICLKFIPANQDVVFVSNGLDEWELTWAKDNLKVDSFVIINQNCLRHGSVIDLLLEKYQKPFGILDYDCIVFDPTYFSKINKINKDTLVNAIFYHNNLILNLNVPMSFILFFNTPVINNIKSKYHVSSSNIKYNQLPLIVKKRVSTIGIDQNHYPENYKKYFDTMRVWMFLGIIDGYKCNYLENLYIDSASRDSIYHIGAGNSTNRLDNWWDTKGTYYWRRSLEASKDQALRKYYYQRYGNLMSSDILRIVPESIEKIGKEFFLIVEEVIKYDKRDR